MRAVAVYSDADRDALHVRLADEAVLHRPGPSARELSHIGAFSMRRARTGARGDPSRLRLPVRERRLRGGLRGGRARLHRPARRGDRARWASRPRPRAVDGGGGRADRARATPARSATTRSAARGRAHRLPGDDQGGGGRRRQGHARRAEPTRVRRRRSAAARREAQAAFGDDAVLPREAASSRPRHVEIQVLADAHGNVVHLGERDARSSGATRRSSRRAPAPASTPDLRARDGRGRRRARRGGRLRQRRHGRVPARRQDGAFYFLEMNTRLQVEHPVTELVTGVDLVRAQLRVAAGEPLPLRAGGRRAARPRHRVRVYAEDPANGFLPSTGRVLVFAPPRGQACASTRRRGGRRRRRALRPDAGEADRLRRGSRGGD